MNSKIEINEGQFLPADQLTDLYNSVEWSAYTAEDSGVKLQDAINNSTYVVSAWKEQTLIGLARCLSDDVSIFYLQDILIRPEFQRLGVGRQLLQKCLDRFDHVRMKVLITNDEDRQIRFYKSMGYQNTASLSKIKLNTFVQVAGQTLE